MEPPSFSPYPPFDPVWTLSSETLRHPPCRLMGHQDRPVDAESLQKGHRRGGCLDAFLVASVVFLFVAVAAVTVCGIGMAKELWVQLESSKRPAFDSTVSHFTGGGEAAQAYKMQNFAYLKVNLSHLDRNSTMQWAPVHFGEGISVGTNFLFDPEQHSLTPQEEGMYFMYMNLKFTCTHRCRAGLFVIRVGDGFTCEVELPAASRYAREKCWRVTWLKKEKLLSQITVPEGGLSNWKLETTGSEFGMFLVD